MSNNCGTTGRGLPFWARLVNFYARMRPAKISGRVIRTLQSFGAVWSPRFHYTMADGIVWYVDMDYRPNYDGNRISFIPEGVNDGLAQIIRSILKRGDTFIDVGANRGMFSIMASKAVGCDGRIIAIEPIPPTAEILTKNLELNGCELVTVFRVAAGEQIATLRVSINKNELGLASLRKEIGPADNTRLVYDIIVEPLDKIVKDALLKPVDLLKIDVEGFELAVLKGAKEVLRNSRPIVIFEVEKRFAAEARWSLEDIWSAFKQCAPYRFGMITRDGRVQLLPDEPGWPDLGTGGDLIAWDSSKETFVLPLLA